MHDRHPIDQRHALDDDPFSYQVTKEEKVFIAWRGRRIMTLRGAEARRFLDRITPLDRKHAQLLMARITGNFKRGNERPTRRGT
ncbi:MAG: hypothetical protein AB7R89_31260 [Dehalococcoidia bacterium]